MIGGIFAGIVGPQLVIATKDLWQPHLFATTYLAQAGLALVSAAVLMLVRIPKPVRRERGGLAARSAKSYGSRASSWRSSAASRAMR